MSFPVQKSVTAKRAIATNVAKVALAFGNIADLVGVTAQMTQEMLLKWNTLTPEEVLERLEQLETLTARHELMPNKSKLEKTAKEHVKALIEALIES